MQSHIHTNRNTPARLRGVEPWMVGGALGKGMALEDAGTMGRQGQNFFVLASICFQRQLALTQHRLGAQHDSQQDLLSSLLSTILSNPGQLLPSCVVGACCCSWCGGQRDVGTARRGQDGLTPFGASSSADLVVGLVELALMPPTAPTISDAAVCA